MSDDIYYKMGVLLEDDIFLNVSTTATGVTGEAANFTMLLVKDGVGNQSTTGMTITEVSSTTNPGLYHLSCNPTTSFVASTGDYSLKISWNTSPIYSWEKTYRVNTTGLPTGTAGAARFDAALGDGRVTDGSSALEGATVYIQTPANKPYVSIQTDASGLWSVNFPSDGTWPVEIQLAGYSILSSSILTSSSTATGPATDLALTAISTASGMLLSNLKTYARYQVRGNVGSSADGKIVAAINAAASSIAKAHKWSWLKTDGDFTFHPAYTTGTITLTNNDATVLFNDATVPSWATGTNAVKILYNGQMLRVASRTDSTHVELVTAWAGDTVTTGYYLFQDEYELPADCLIFGRIFPGTGYGWNSDIISFESLRQYQNDNNFVTTVPTFTAVHNNKLVVWPAPSVSRNWPAIYQRQPAILVNNSDELDFDPLMLNLVNRAMDYQLALRFGPIEAGDAVTCLAAYTIELNSCVSNDKENGPRTGIGRSPRRSTIADRTLPDAL